MHTDMKSSTKIMAAMSMAEGELYDQEYLCQDFLGVL
jgi:hypothetical protein